MKASFFFLAAGLFLTSCQTKPTDAFRSPANTQELISGSRQVLNDISNPQVFNPQTCTSYINKVTDYLFKLPANHFIPKNAREADTLKSAGPELMDTIFQIRLAMHDKLQEFDKQNSLSRECTLKMREGFQYARFSEEYLLDWLVANKAYNYTPKPILDNSKPSTWTNPKFEGFKLKSGDVMIIRGKSYVSAMIARIGDEEGNFSHLAIIGEDKKGNKYVVEALIQYGTIVTPLEKWRTAEDARVALYRQPDAALAKAAARKIYDHAQGALDKNLGIRYDFSMNDADYSSFFCSEVIRFAYDKASNGRFMVPKFRSNVSKFKNHEYPKTLGVKGTSLFAPYDLEVDPRFDFVAEYRFLPLLRQVRMQDAVLQSVYEWMIKKDYTFNWTMKNATRAHMAKFLRDFGLFKDTLPRYMPIEAVKTTVQFEAVANTLEENLYAKEKEFYAKYGYSPSFQDMMKINDEYRIEDCKRGQRPTLMKPTKFHSFFKSSSDKCE